MTPDDKPNFPKTGIHRYVAEYINDLPDLNGKVVLDVPCGVGRASYEFKQKGADVIALDLFPEFMTLSDVKAEYADLSEKLPIESESIDYIICQEGIEHIPNQLSVLEEFNRVLKKKGTLLITTPNNSHIRSRLSHLFFETDIWNRMPPTELDSIWFAEGKSDKLYFGHLFLLGVQHFQTLIAFAGFKVTKRIKTDIGNTSTILGLVMYPLIALFTAISYFSYLRKNSHIQPDMKQTILWERVKLNLSPKTLFYKHLFWELRKTGSIDEAVMHLKKMQKRIQHHR